ncbi:MAG: WD-40 repeat-containing [Planctomycetota bacterium]|nr:MAG: WD-40 repeat-containing [Planctomycetota bacterium]
MFATLFLTASLSSGADDAAVDALITQLGGDDPATRDAAEAKLIEVGPSAEARLREREKKAEPEVKARIGRALDGIAAGSIATTDFEAIRTINVGHASITGLAWTPDGKKLVSCGGWGDIRIWDAVTGKQLAKFKTEEGFVPGLAFAGDPNRLWISGENVVCWDLEKGTAIKSFKGGGHTGVHVAPGGKRVVWKTGGINVVNAETLEVERVIKADEMFMDSIAFSPDGAKLAIELANHVAVFDLVTGERDAENPLGNAEYEGSIMSLGWLSDGQVVVVNREGIIRWGEHKEDCRPYCWEIAVAPDGKRFAVAGMKNALRILDPEGKELQSLPMGGSHCRGLAWSPDGKRLAAGNESGRLAIWSDGAQDPLEFPGHTQCPERAVFSPDSSLVAASLGGNHWTAFVNIEDGTSVDVKGLFGPQPGRTGSEFISTEKFDLVTWDAKTGKRSGTPSEGRGGPRREVAFASPDGTLAWTEGYMVPADKRFHSFTDKPAPEVKGNVGCSWASAAWSGDSEYIAISGVLDFHGHIGAFTIVRRDGTIIYRADGLERGGGAPCWTPDGTKLFWSHGEDLFVFDRAKLKEPEQRKAGYQVAGFLDAVSLVGVREKGEKERELVLVHVPTMRIARTWPLPEYGRVTVAPDRKKIMVLSQEGAAVLRVVKREGK